jgi:hypothetical protein
MAAKSEIILPNGDKVTGNWSTEETMASILKVLEAKYGKTGTGGAAKKEEAVAAKKNKLGAKLQDGVNKRLKKAQERIQGLSEATKKQLEQHPRVAKSLDFLADSTKLAGTGIKKLGGKAKDLHDGLDGLDGSAQSTSNSFMTLVGGAGALGTAFGFVAGIIDQYADFQIAAMQTGFGFSSELTNTRMEVGRLGLNMAQYGRILVDNGEAIRSLGRTGLDSSNEFIKLIDSVKTTAYEFGMFGMTTEEVANAVAAQLNVARLQGYQGAQATAAITEGFNELNHQVLAYSKLTGRERREIMRNNLETREGSEALIANLGKYGPEAQASYNIMMSNIAGIFGKRGGDELAGLMDAEFSQFFLGGMEQMSQDQLTALSFVPGLKDEIEATREQVMANINDPEEVGKIMLAASREIGEILQANQDKLAKDAVMFADQSYGPMLASLLSAGQEANNFMTKTPEDIAKALGPMEANERNLMLIRDRIDTLQNTFMGAILKGMGIDNLEDLANEGTFDGLMTGIDTFGDKLASFREGIVAVADFFGVDSPTGVIALMTAGAVALFAANSVFTMAMVAGATKVWSKVGGMGGKGWGIAALLTYFATDAIGTVNDSMNFISPPGVAKKDELTQYANGSLDSARTAEITAGMNDLIKQNQERIAYMLDTVGENYKSSIEYNSLMDDTYRAQHLLSGGVNMPAGAYSPEYYRKGITLANPEYIPNIPDKLTGIVQGATHGANPGDVNVGMDPSNAWRFRNSDNDAMARLAAAMEENNRLMRIQTNAITEQ